MGTLHGYYFMMTGRAGSNGLVIQSAVIPGRYIAGFNPPTHHLSSDYLAFFPSNSLASLPSDFLASPRLPNRTFSSLAFLAASLVAPLAASLADNMEEVKWTTWRPEPVTITRHPLQDESGRFTEPPAVKWPLTVYSMEELEFGATQGLYNAFFYNGPDDDTCRILGAFWQHLPESGQLLIMAEIVYLSCHKDPLGSLRQLADFLIEAIIKPCKSPTATPPRSGESRASA